MLAIYCRISKHKEQGRDVSIAVQKKQGIEFAQSLGLEYQVFVDEGLSGADEDISKRPAFVMMLDGIKKKEILEVYCYDQSRIERNNIIWNLFTSLMLEKKCQYYPGGRLLDLDVPENKFFTGVISLANQLYAASTGLKVKAAIYENAKKGKTHGLTAYGYEKGDNGFFKINDEEAKVIKRIYQMSLDGIGTYTIAKILNEEGIPPKFHHFEGQMKRIDKYTKKLTIFNKKDVIWRGNVIHDIIRNTLYKGNRKWNNEEIPVPAILEAEYWQSVNDNLVNNKKNVGKREEYQYLLNGLIYCEECGSEFRGKKRLKGRDRAYKCKGKSKHNITCNSRGINITKVESFIIQHLFISKDLRTYLTKLTVDKGEANNLKSKLYSLKKEYERNVKIEKKAYDRLLDPDFEDDSNIKERLQTVKKIIQEQMKTILLLENKLIEIESNSRIKRIGNTIDGYKLTSGFDDTKILVHSLIKKITIKHEYNESKSGKYFLKIEYKGFDEISLFMTDWQALKWYWLSNYRERAITDEDLADDRDLFQYLTKTEAPTDFVGFESSSSGLMIELDKTELINFN